MTKGSFRAARILAATGVLSLVLGGLAATPAVAQPGPTVDLQVTASVDDGPRFIGEYLSFLVHVTNVGNMPSNSAYGSLTNVAGSTFTVESWGELHPGGSGLNVMPGETRTVRVYGLVKSPWSGSPRVRVGVLGPHEVNPADNETELTVPVIDPDTKDTIGGQLFADKDGNGSASPGEGLPGIKVVLEMITNGVPYERTTDTEGRFSFTDVPVGADYYLSTPSMPKEWYVPDMPGGFRLDGSGTNTNVQLLARRPLSADLSATSYLDKKSYVAGETAKLVIKLTNTSSLPISGITSGCDRAGNWRDLDITQANWGELAYQGAGATIPGGQTRTFVIPGTVSDASAKWGFVEQYCDFTQHDHDLDGVPETGVEAKVTGLQGATTGEYFHDDNANHQLDAGEGLADTKLVLTDVHNGRIIAARTDANGRTTATGPAGRYRVQIIGPWRVLDDYTDLYLTPPPNYMDGWQHEVGPR
jgi:hypothetical protein